MIDDPSLSIHGIFRSVLQNLGPVTCSDDARYAHLARHDRRMARGPSIIRYDCSCYLHVWNPVRVRHPCDEAVLLSHQPPCFLEVQNDLGLSSMESWAGGQSLRSDRLPGSLLGGLRRRFHPAPEGLWSRLHEVDLFEPFLS